MKVIVEPVYTSVACNRIPEIVDWNEEGLICFGACNAVVIWDTKLNGKDPLTVLSHHRSLVNSVKWLRKPDGTCTELVSCSADKTAAIWTLEDGNWKVTSELTGHKDGVTSVNGIYTYNGDLVVFTGCIDSNIRIWERRNGTAELKQTINLNYGLCLTLHAHLLPKVRKPVLFCALDDFKVHIFAGDDEYHRVHTLSGHEDWVRGLDVMNVDDTTILLASVSQDTYIRLWRIQVHTEQEESPIRVEEKVFQAYGETWSVKLDAVLAGHEGWVYGVQWHPSNQDNKSPTYKLLSSSLDKTLILWENTGGKEGAGDGSWGEKVRVGECGGNGLGFYGSRFGPDGNKFLGHGYNGSFHVWKLNEETNQWEPDIVCGGHFGVVEDLRWEPARGRYLLSVASDQTARVHAPCRTDRGKVEWHEIARPQIHGYDMASVALVSPTVYASAAEEKVIRVFGAPRDFIQNFERVTGLHLASTNKDGGDCPVGASVPSLGLSNKAVFGAESKTDVEEDNDRYFVPVTMDGPPTEETLMQNTLWPETHKLYGHGYEVYCLDASPDGRFVASACKATVQEHAQVLIWETKTWKNTQKLTSHQLTVTQLAFSPDSRRLLSVSRDRRWTVFRKEGSVFDTEASTDKKNGVHTRIIWCCAWAHDSSVFATGSRDGKVCIWTKTDTTTLTSLGPYSLVNKPLELANTSVTALAFAPILVNGAKLLATGFESGIVRLYLFGDDGWNLLREMDNNMAHHLTVKRLWFRPGHQLELASCGADHFLRIHAITLS